MKVQINPHKLILLCTVMILLLCQGCGNQSGTAVEGETESSAAPVETAATTPDTDSDQDPAIDLLPENLVNGNEKDYYGDYQETGGEVALVIDFSNVIDNGFNQAAYEGARTYACAAGVSYSYYSASQNTEEEYEKTLMTAIENHAKFIICAGSHFEQAMGNIQNDYPDIYFLMLDGVPKDASGKELPIASNVHCIAYHEEEAGYLAGYMTVLEGYTNLGFIGGEQLPAVQRYGMGYLQGIDDAARELGISDNVTVNYWYANTFQPGENVEKVSAEWYESGTQVIFACGGSLYESVLASAERFNGLLIGADTDQSNISELFLTSAMKEIKYSVIMALDDYFACGNIWSEALSGKMISYGAEDKCIGLPLTDNAWRFKKASYADYTKLLSHIKTGEIEISASTSTKLKTSIHVVYQDK